MSTLPIWDSLKINKTDPEQVILERMSDLRLFENITRGGLKYIRSMCHIRVYSEGQHVFRAGEPGVGMYILLEGAVQIYVMEDDRIRVLKEHTPGEFFGELGLLDDLPRSASARASEDTRLLGFFRPDLESIIRRKPALASSLLLNIGRVVGQKLINTNHILEKTAMELRERDKESGTNQGEVQN